jgi:predicted site-specific integrase-resolvase
MLLGVDRHGYLRVYYNRTPVKKMEKQELIKAVVYFRTSSDTNADKDTLKRQIEAATKYAKAAGFDLIAEYRDDGVKGADTRLSFAAMLRHIASRRRGWSGA